MSSHPAEPTLEQLEKNFSDIAPPLTRDAAVAEAHRCLFCYDAPCTAACPTHIDVPAFIKKIATGNMKGSAREILEPNPFGHSCARACPVEVLCEGACVLNDRDEQPIKIALLQRHATDYLLHHGIKLFQPGPDTGKRVAVVGAGPAGLSCARELRRMGHAVTCYEAQPLGGGLCTYGIAEYKLKPATALAEVADILELGVELKNGVRVGQDVTVQQLLDQYQAVFVAVGLAGVRKLGIPGDHLPGVVDAIGFIEALKTRPYQESRIRGKVVVVGAGNTAIDAVTQAKRLGATEASIVYRRGEEDMPAYDYEYQLAKGDGCRFMFHSTPLRILGQDTVEGLVVESPDGETVIECDLIIYALGQTVGALELPEDPRIFKGGDFDNGGAEIVNAAAEGIAAARRIHEMLQ